ncbi:MAG TPA: thioesterase family protein [Bryobacteraceae bacterium]|jgi:fluoroacetyl-CoA thioesterase|nr:thioesterase family protein [Bryobacteraceae bacterium]
MATIPAGLKGEHRRRVTDEIAINFLGLDGARVLATPAMIGLLEMTCRDSILPLLDAGFDSVGTEVNVKHLAATPMGMEVTFTSEVITVDDRRIRFKVAAFDEKEQIADGTHERFVINVERFAKRLAEKNSSR